MKKTFRVLGIIAIIAVIGFSMAACSDDSGANSLVGIWYYTQEAANARSSTYVFYEFKSNGALFLANSDTGLKWSEGGGRITLSYLGITTGSANYSISGTALTIWNAGDSGLRNGTYYKPR